MYARRRWFETICEILRFMQRTFADMNDPLNALTQAVISFGFCLLFGIFYVWSIARNREGR